MTEPCGSEVIHEEMAGTVTVAVSEWREMVQTAPGIRTPTRHHVEISVFAYDGCGGPEHLSTDEARQLRDALDWAIAVAETDGGAA